MTQRLSDYLADRESARADERRKCAAELRDWLDSRPVTVRVDGVDYLSVASVRAFADGHDRAVP